MNPHQPLRDDVRLLGELLGDTIRAREGEAVLDRVERVRAIAKRSHAGDPTAFQQLEDELRELPIAEAVPIARAFAHFLALVNIAEQHHRIRRRRDYARDSAHRPQPGSCESAFALWLAEGLSRQELSRHLRELRIELVLTAHPTEIVRRTVLQAHRRIAGLLTIRDHEDLTPGEAKDAEAALRREIETIWQTEEVRRSAVTPMDEVRGGLAVFEQSLWQALPRYVRRIEEALGASLPLDAAPLRFGSWIGGDRDGNPNVTPDVTRKAIWMARWTAADLYGKEIDDLRSELSLSSSSDELRRAVGACAEPYRALLRDVAARLRATRDEATAQIEEPGDGLTNRVETLTPMTNVAQPLRSANDLEAPLLLCHRSLMATGNALIAEGRLTDILRRVAAFGLALARLDIRQESARHSEAIDWIARRRQLGPYAEASEEARIALLFRELTASAQRGGDLPAGEPPPDPVRDVLETFRMAATLPAESLGAYVITMTSEASDVLAVELLQQLAGNTHPQRVVPLFETARDLQRAGGVLETLFALPWYRDRIAGRQEVMIGYSDSAKDAGRFAAAWALYRAQEQIVEVCERHGIHLTLFHGRGGSVGRGGGPTHLAIRSQPPGSIRGQLRVTEQGEMIQAQFGLPDIAVRTMEVYTTATLEATLRPAAPPPPDWRAAMDSLAERSRAAYRATVYDQPQFLEYFHAATPEPELRRIHIGSRPARRGGGDEIEKLRAIPWQFAWTQTRLLLPSWLGIETALGEEVAGTGTPLVKTMYEQWPFFQSAVDLMEMVLAKADPRIAAAYDRRLVPPYLQPLGNELRNRLANATAAALAITGHREPVENNRVLRRSIDVRNPYVDPINLVQIELLARLRDRGSSPDANLERAFVITVNGIAAGMRNTG